MASMAPAAIKSPTEQKKIIAAIGLGLAAIVLLWWTFFGCGSSSTKTPVRNTNRPVAVASPLPGTPNQRPSQPDNAGTLVPSELTEIKDSITQPLVPEPRRNIFAFYEKPIPVIKPSPVLVPSPTPTPPILLASVSPANVYARTDDFNLEVTGDKFNPSARISKHSREL